MILTALLLVVCTLSSSGTHSVYLEEMIYDEKMDVIKQQLISLVKGSEVLVSPCLEMNLEKFQGEINRIRNLGSPDDVLYVESSAYTACVKECGLTPETTAIGSIPKPMRTVAVSRDLEYLMGKEIRIAGCTSYWIVEDRMHHKWENCIDFLYPNKKAAFGWGRRHIKIFVY